MTSAVSRHFLLLTIFSTVAVVLVSGGGFDPTMFDSPLTALLTMPPPDGSAGPNAQRLAQCMQPGGDPSTTLLDGVPTNMQMPLLASFPGIAGPMAMISCGQLQQDMQKYGDLIQQFADGKLSPEEFIKKMMAVDPLVTMLIMDILRDIKKAIDELANMVDEPLKSMLQQASNELGKIIDDPVKELSKMAQQAKDAWSSLSPEMQQYLKDSAKQLPSIMESIGQMLSPPPS